MIQTGSGVRIPRPLAVALFKRLDYLDLKIAEREVQGLLVNFYQNERDAIVWLLDAQGVKYEPRRTAFNEVSQAPEDPHEFVRLGRGCVVAILGKLGGTSPPRAIAEAFKVPMRLVQQIQKLGPEAIGIAEQAAAQRRQETPHVGDVKAWEAQQTTPVAPPLGAVPVEVQRQVIEAWRREYSVDEISGLLALERDQVLTVLQDAGYAVSVVQTETVAEDQARAQGWRS